MNKIFYSTDTMNTKKLLNISLLLIIILFNSCKTKERISQAESELTTKSQSELFKDVLNNELSYTTFSSKLNMTISTGTKTISSKGSLRIINNEAIQISVQPLFGIEMFRLYIEPKQLIVLDRMNKRYVEESLDTLSEENSFGFNFYTLQSLFTNNLFIPSKKDVTLEDYKTFKLSETKESYQLKSRDKKSNVDYTFYINGNDQITDTKLNLPQKKYSLDWSYNDFLLIKNLFFPHEMKIVASTQKRSIDTSISMLDINLNNDISLDSSIPSNYTRVKLSDVLKLLSDKK